MVFSSVPAVYLDPPNWPHNQQGAEQHQQQSIMNITNGIMSTNSSSLHHLPPPPPPHGPTGCGSPSLIRPGSMVDRARLARLPLPEAGLKCPRCESTNTKFCYFNNYSLSQPRHFCKTCRRYWTRGGALRSVPVGGCCRRNKRSSKSSSSSTSTGSKSPISLHRRTSSSTNATGSSRGLFSGATPSTALKNFTVANLLPPTPTQLPFLPSLQGLNNDHVTGGFGGLNLGAIAGDMEFQMGLSSASGLSRVQQQQQHHHYFQSLAGLDSGLYPFQHGGSSTHHHDVDHGGGSGGVKPTTMMGTAAADEVSGGRGGIMQDDSSTRVKSEDSSGHLGLNLSQNLLGIQENNSDTGGADQLGHDQYNRWSTTTATAGVGAAAGNEWADLSVFSSSSSTSHLM